MLPTFRGYLAKVIHCDQPVWIRYGSVRKAVIDGVSTQLVDPNRIVVPLAVEDASHYRWPQPKNIWKITTIKAENLINADGVSNSSSSSN